MIEKPDTGIKCAGNDNTGDDVVCGENQQLLPTGIYTSITGLTGDIDKQDRCCTVAPPAATETETETAGSAAATQLQLRPESRITPSLGSRIASSPYSG
jgi:hypothetical protein